MIYFALKLRVYSADIIFWQNSSHQSSQINILGFFSFRKANFKNMCSFFTRNSFFTQEEIFQEDQAIFSTLLYIVSEKKIEPFLAKSSYT